MGGGECCGEQGLKSKFHQSDFYELSDNWETHANPVARGKLRMYNGAQSIWVVLHTP